jgi:hypothetical protein
MILKFLYIVDPIDEKLSKFPNKLDEIEEFDS